MTNKLIESSGCGAPRLHRFGHWCLTEGGSKASSDRAEWFVACEACRARKRKCDEQRPKCALCRRLKIDCHYKDRTLNKADTLSDILTVLQQVSDGVNEILSANTVAHARHTFQEQNGVRPSTSSIGQPSEVPCVLSAPLYKNELHTDHADAELAVAYRHSTATHQLLKWPFVWQSLQSRLDRSQNIIFDSGIDWFLSIHHSSSDNQFPSRLCSPADINVSHPLVDITYSNTMRYAKTYFDTSNYMHPLLDRTIFFQETLPTAMGTVLKATHRIGDESLLITLLVLALGELALSIIMNDRESTEHDRHLSQSPPGLKYFNEVRKRLGFLHFSPSLAIVHIEAMTSLYYAACFRHMDSWRMSVKASESCYLLIKR
ncbi:hypothetical protein CI102_14814 [Trichoderma harzianum]|nr:hypothetical protein CI102_14814 [Trichoderma harzianum]